MNIILDTPHQNRRVTHLSGGSPATSLYFHFDKHMEKVFNVTRIRKAKQLVLKPS